MSLSSNTQTPPTSAAIAQERWLLRPEIRVDHHADTNQMSVRLADLDLSLSHARALACATSAITAVVNSSLADDKGMTLTITYLLDMSTEDALQRSIDQLTDQFALIVAQKVAQIRLGVV